PDPVRPGNQRQGAGRPDRHPGATQQVGLGQGQLSSMAGMLRLPERLTQAEAVECLADLSRRMRDGAGWALDASALTDFDSSALAVLIALQREARAAGSTLRV